MTRRIILFELRFWLRQPMLWIFLGAAVLFSMAIMVFEQSGGSGSGMVFLNSPVRIYQLYANLAMLGLPASEAGPSWKCVANGHSAVTEWIVGH